MATDRDKLDALLAQHEELGSAKERPAALNFLWYGRPKVGKTTLALHLGKRILHVSGDGGWTVVKDYPDIADRVTPVVIKSIRHFEYICEGLREGLPRYDEYDHIIIDPVNHIVNSWLRYIQKMWSPSKEGDNRTKYMPTAEGTKAKLTSFTEPGLSDYRAARDWLADCIEGVTSLDKMVSFVCHAKEPGVTEKDSAPMRAALPGQCYELLAAEVDVIGYMEAKSSTNVTVSMNPSAREDAGSRIKALHGLTVQAKDLPLKIEQWQRGELNNG